MMSKQEEIFKKITAMADINYPNSEIYLFGSRVNGKEDNDSDWDFLVLLNQEKISFSQETQIMDDFYEIELDMASVLSPLVYSKSEWKEKYKVTPLYKNIKMESLKVR